MPPGAGRKIAERDAVEEAPGADGEFENSAAAAKVQHVADGAVRGRATDRLRRLDVGIHHAVDAEHGPRERALVVRVVSDAGDFENVRKVRLCEGARDEVHFVAVGEGDERVGPRDAGGGERGRIVAIGLQHRAIHLLAGDAGANRVVLDERDLRASFRKETRELQTGEPGAYDDRFQFSAVGLPGFRFRAGRLPAE